jgi:hypothetical protein
MADSHEEEIYSIMFSSLKHPVRRKILRMLGSKSMTFMEMVEELGVSSPHLTYHLESLGELVSKLDNGKYKLSAFGLATVSAMQGVEDVREVEPKRQQASFKGKAILGMLLATIVLLASVSVFQFATINQLSSSQQMLLAENEQLMSWGVGTDKMAVFVRNITHIDTRQYTISLLSSTVQWRTDLAGVSEEVTKYSLTSSNSNLNIDLRFRNGHFSRYELTMIESSPIFTQIEPYDVLQNAKGILARYKLYSGDAYLTEMSNLLATVNETRSLAVTTGNMKLEITISGSITVLFWMYTENNIDYQAKGLQMTFQGNVLTTMSDGYFLYTIGDDGMTVTLEEAVTLAKNYVKTLTWTIEGKPVSGFNVLDAPLSVQLVPHTRGNSVELIPYWYVKLSLDKIYGGGINEVAIGIYADTAQVSDVQMLSGAA